MNELRARPQHYNTLTNQLHDGRAAALAGEPEVSALFLEGPPQRLRAGDLYELGRLDRSRPFSELQRLSRVNDRATGADRDPAFSQRIREVSRHPGHRRERRLGSDSGSASRADGGGASTSRQMWWVTATGGGDAGAGAGPWWSDSSEFHCLFRRLAAVAPILHRLPTPVEVTEARFRITRGET